MQVDSIHVNKSCITAKQTKNKLYEDVIVLKFPAIYVLISV